MMNSISVLVLDGQSDFSVPVIRCLADTPDVKIHVLSIDKWAPSQFSRHVASFEVVDVSEGPEQRLGIIRDAVRRKNVDVMLPVAEDAIRFVAAHREEMRHIGAIPPTPELEPFEVISDKWGLAQFTTDHGIPAPCTTLLPAGDAMDLRTMGLRFPVLCKPTDRSNGSGIHLCQDQEALIMFAGSTTAKESRYLVQRFIEGFDIDCSVLCVEGSILAYTVQRGFIGSSQPFAPPVGIEFVQEDRTLDVVEQLMRKLRWTGVAHVDLRYDIQEDVPKVIEVNARYWRSLLGSLVAGVNFPNLACRTALGETFPVPEYRHSRFISKPLPALRYLMHPKGMSGVASVSFAETNFAYMFRDPLPDLVREIRNLYRGRRWYPEKDEDADPSSLPHKAYRAA
jgi:predicted ATP-grasp superfamily ATP-dependent carboligase